MAAHAIDGLASPVLAPRVLDKLQQWFPRWHSYGLAKAFSAMGEWPDDPRIRPTLWRGLHDEYLGSAQAAAQSIASGFRARPISPSSLCRLVAAPPTIGAAAAAMEALCGAGRNIPSCRKFSTTLACRPTGLIAVTAIRGRIALGVQTPEDFELLTRLAEPDDYSVGEFVDQAMIDGWAGNERLRTYALNETPGERGRRVRHLRPDFGLLINGFPGDHEVAKLVAADLTNQHPHCLFEKEDLRALAEHFKNDSTIVPALEAWVIKYRSDDGYTLSHAARVAPTPTLKAALLRCVENDRLSFWAAPALVDLWGAADAEVRKALLAAAEWPVEKRQHVAHTLPHVVTDKAECRRLLLEIFAGDDRIRVDFALQGISHLGIDATDREATDHVLARGYDAERFAVENEAAEVIDIFRDDPRVVELAKRQLQREGGVIGAVASVFAGDAEMRRLVLHAATPLEFGMRISILEFLHARAGPEGPHRDFISAARRETAEETIVGASIKLGQLNHGNDQISADYLAETRRELEAIGPRMDARRQGAMGALVAVKRLDLLPAPDRHSGMHGIGVRKLREMLKFVATEWAGIVESLGGEDAALAALGVSRDDFFDTFGNDLSASESIGALALRLVENSPDHVPATAIRFTERTRPGSGFLRDVCLRGLNYNGRTNWDTYSTALTAGEVLGRNFSGEQALEDQLLATINANMRNPGAIMALCEGWPRSDRFLAMRSRFRTGRNGVPVSMRLATIFSTPERFVDVLGWAAENLQGDLWESPAHWIPAVVRRLKTDDEAYGQMRTILFDEPSPSMKASFPRILAQARTLDADLRDWCRAECAKEEGVFVAEVGTDLIAGQRRLVRQSLFDLLIGRAA